MSDQDARIRLAEAMGWKWRDIKSAFQPGGGQWHKPDGKFTSIIKYKEHIPFDPFTDANDDYAVLNWARERGLQDANGWSAFHAALGDYHKVTYQIGDYARAALTGFCPTETQDGD